MSRIKYLLILFFILTMTRVVNAEVWEYSFQYFVDVKSEFNQSELKKEDLTVEVNIGWQFKITDVDCFVWMDLTRCKEKETIFPKCGFARIEVSVRYQNKCLYTLPGTSNMQFINLDNSAGDLMFDDIKLEVENDEGICYVEVVLVEGNMGSVIDVGLVDAGEDYESLKINQFMTKFSNCWYRGDELNYYADFASLDPLSVVEETKILKKYKELDKIVEF